MANKVFISYRRNDCKAEAGRLYDYLAKHVGRRQIFMDVDTIEPGLDFFHVLEKAVAESEVLVAVIGPSWISAADPEGKRRLDDPKDLVRAEIAVALRRNIRVIPVLVNSAKMPKPSDLPGEIAALTRRQAIAITHERFSSDAEALLKAINATKAKSGVRNAPLIALATAMTFAGGLAGANYLRPDLFSNIVRWQQPRQELEEKLSSPSATGEPKRTIEERPRPTQRLVSAERGLAQIRLEHESIVLYATAPGGVSMDGDKGNSPFAAAISVALKEGVSDVELLAKKVVASVRLESKNQQSPIYETNLTRSINLADKQFDKIALIIGNSAYANVAYLANPARDAEVLARQLGHLDFETIVALDAGYAQMKKTIDRFASRLKSPSLKTAIEIRLARGGAASGGSWRG